MRELPKSQGRTGPTDAFPYSVFCLQAAKGRCCVSRHTPALPAGVGAVEEGAVILGDAPSLQIRDKKPAEARRGSPPRSLLFVSVNHITKQSARVVNFIFC